MSFMKEVELTLVAISSSSSQKDHFVLVFEELNSSRRLPVIVGNFEAQAIAMALERMKPRRPMTHDLFRETIIGLGAHLEKVLIYSFMDEVFYARLILMTEKGEVSIDARTSDAVALAVRFGCQIFTTEEVMSKASVVLDDPTKAFSNKRGRLQDYSLEELERILENLLKKEDYRSAARVRSAIEAKKRKS